MSVHVRRVEAGEWSQVKDLRLRALADPAAPIAFLDTVEHASGQPDRFWQERTVNAAEPSAAAQFVAVTDAGSGWAPPPCCRTASDPRPDSSSASTSRTSTGAPA